MGTVVGQHIYVGEGVGSGYGDLHIAWCCAIAAYKREKRDKVEVNPWYGAYRYHKYRV